MQEHLAPVQRDLERCDRDPTWPSTIFANRSPQPSRQQDYHSRSPDCGGMRKATGRGRTNPHETHDFHHPSEWLSSPPTCGWRKATARGLAFSSARYDAAGTRCAISARLWTMRFRNAIGLAGRGFGCWVCLRESCEVRWMACIWIAVRWRAQTPSWYFGGFGNLPRFPNPRSLGSPDLGQEQVSKSCKWLWSCSWSPQSSMEPIWSRLNWSEEIHFDETFRTQFAL